MASRSTKYRKLAGAALFLFIIIWAWFSLTPKYDSTLTAERNPINAPGSDVTITDDPVSSPQPLDSKFPVRSDHHLYPRDPSPDFPTCFGRGCKLNGKLDADALPSADQTPFTRYQQLAQYGWLKSQPRKTLSEFSPLQQALQDIDLPTEASDASWVKLDWVHQRSSRGTAGQDYPATAAYYINIYNVQYGAILATNNEGPEHVDYPPPKENLVPLRQLSDVWFLTWVNLCRSQQQVQGIKYVFRVNIASEATRNVIGDVVGGDIMSLPGYPGRDFYLSSWQGLALLGTPNGNGVAWFLAQHKASFGEHRTVTRIRVWDAKADDPQYRDRYGPSPSMMFEISGIQDGNT